MLGTIVNTTAILVGTTIGTFARKGINPKIQDVLFNAMGLASLALGAGTFINNTGKSPFPVLFIISLAIGGVLGTLMNFSGRVDDFAKRHNAEGLVNGITSASLLFCIGTFSIVGPVLSALKGDNTFLYTNATLDFVTSAVFAATYGFGIAWCAAILFTWQGSIYLTATLIQDAEILQGTLLNDLSAVGGVLIISSGLAILKLKDCKTLNLLPSLLIPVIWYIIYSTLISNP